MVEVFVNGKLYLAMRVYPSRQDSVGVSVRAQGQDAVLKCLSALPPAGQQEATVTHEATGLTLKVKLSRTGKDQPVTIEAQEA